MRTGIRWSELNRLPYWDPVVNVTLGVMHNWFEGVLQHHFISQWGLDYINISQEHDNLEAAETFQESPGEDSEMSIDKEINNEDSGYLTEDIKRRIQERICKVIVPKGATRIPPLVFKSQIGKLKQSEWNPLFSIYLPMVFLEVMWGIAINNYTPNLFDMLLNFGALVQCTNIVGAKAVKQEYSTRFSENYNTYQKTSLKLFPKCQHVPNHHYAMHIPDQLKFWGPPMGILQFSGEPLIGELQNLKCKFLPGAMDATFMLKFCQRQRLEVLKKDKDDPKGTPLHKKVEFNDDTYYALLEYLQQSHPNLRDHRMVPHPSSSLVL
ncbi:hypothetical protein O181_122260 [Austropuccinia psidii MF-1]|uniref:Uncharacterized protein n=1 Tax=Austropuccinia psidii MF-1 TaxID=1389203 RepID=A0A9Q3Q336_9BASI|nr:hypothetical protein [Austropuccinia psidii MF-1]